MAWKASSSALGRAVSAAAAALAVVLYVLDRTTDLPVPYGHEGVVTLDGTVGAGVAVGAVGVALLATFLRRRDALSG